MNCTTVRDRLAEHALGALPPREAAPVDRHLAWCAACRKEAIGLQGASAILAFGVPDAEPDPGLETRVLTALHDAVERDTSPARHVPRRGRLVALAAAAAMVAVIGTSWGAVMADRAAESERARRQEINRSQSAAERFRYIIDTLEFSGSDDEVFLATLSPTESGGGGGSALTLVSPTIIDMAIVLVNGVPEASRADLPFTVRLRGEDGVLLVGRLQPGDIDESGAGAVMQEFDDLAGYDTVVVRDVHQHVVMSGTIHTRAVVASPTP